MAISPQQPPPRGNPQSSPSQGADPRRPDPNKPDPNKPIHDREHEKDSDQDQHGRQHDTLGKDREDKNRRRNERRKAMEDAPPIANEQMERSREIETMGVEEWKRQQDQRPIEEQPVLVKDALPIGDVLNTPPEQKRQVPGVSHPTTPLPDRAPVRDQDGNIPQQR